MLSNKPKFISILALVMCLVGLPMAALSQSTNVNVESDYRVIDLNFVLQNSKLGQELLKRRTAEIETLNEWNIQVTEDLLKEETDLAELRQTMDSESFSNLAEEFNIKSEKFRDEYSQKLSDFEDLFKVWYGRFVRIVLLESADVATKQGAHLILPRESVFWSDPSIDISLDFVQSSDQRFANEAESYKEIIFAPIPEKTGETTENNLPATQTNDINTTEGTTDDASQ